MKLYSCKAVKQLIDFYIRKNGYAVTIEEGSLGYGIMILYGEGLKTTIVKEVYLNQWSSVHTIRHYNKIPNKYLEILKRLELV